MNIHRFAAVVSAVIIALSASGCGQEKTNDSLLDEKNPVTITIWHYYNGVQQTTFDKMITEFNNTVGLEKGIIAEAYSKSSINELASSVIASVNKEVGADNPPDIFAGYAETCYKLDRNGALADLKQYLTEEEINEYIPEYMEEGTFSDGSLKIFPTAKSTEVMMINKTDWDKFAEAEGVAVEDLATVEGVVAAAEKYYNYTDALTPEIPNDGKAFFGRDSVANYMYNGAKQLGCEYVSIDESGNAAVSIDKDVIKKLWENYYIPYVKGHFAARSRYRSDDAKTGTIISLVCSTSGAVYFPSEVTIGDNDPYPIENIVVSVPYFEGTTPYLVQQGASMAVIKSDSSRECASLVFLKWFTEEERNIRFSISSGYLPVKRSANDMSKIIAANDSLETPMDETMLHTIERAISDVNSRNLYTSAPYNKSAETREYIGSFMQDSAELDYESAWQRISVGEDRETVLAEYTSSSAFDAWYDRFVTGLEEILS